MLRAQKRLKKKEIKEDSLVTSYFQTKDFYETHKKQIQTTGTVLLVVIVAAVLYMNNQRQDHEQASGQLTRVYEFYDNGQYQTAIDGLPERNILGLKSIVENYGGTDAGDIARLYLANSYYQLGRYEEALKAYEELDPSHPLIKATYYNGLAGCQEALGRYNDAATNYEQAAAKFPEDLNAAENLFHAGRNYTLAGDKERALDVFKKLKKNHSRTTFAREADRFIARLSV